MSRKTNSAALVTLLLFLTTTMSFAIDEETVFNAARQANTERTFAPVQEGFTTVGRTVVPYAADRLLVQFKVEALAGTNLVSLTGRGARASQNEIGLDSIDELADEAGVLSIERPYGQLKNVAKARELGVDRWFMYRFEKVDDLEDLAARFRADNSVQAVSLDWIAFPAAVPNDPLHPDHWGHNNTAQLPGLDWGGTYGHTLPTTVGTVGFDANAEAAWDASQGYGSASVVIAILDSGVDVGHPDLRQVAGYDYGDNDSNPDDNSASPGHGTACAGVAASMNNSLGAAGIAAGCSIMPLKVANGAGSMFFSAIQNAIYHAADNGADVISMSLGAAISTDSATDAALLYAYNAGCTILAATGNENASTISYPAINTYVISVGAASPCGERKRSSSSSGETNPGVNTDPNGYTCDGERWWGSNYGTNSADARTAVDILGPTILPTTDIAGGGGYESGDYSSFFNGTSCATPYVAGVAALVISQNPTYTPAQVRDALVTNAEDVTSVESGSGWDRYSGYGMVDAAAAVGGGGTNPVPPTAEFSGSPTSGTFPLSVSFSDASTGQPTSWSWNFGDGGSSTSQNPSHTYTSAGSFTVTLTATNAEGSDGETKVNYITTTDPADTYASLPYSTGFESGAVDQYWSLYEGVEGRIRVTNLNAPRTGSFHLLMDDDTNGGSYSQNEAWLQLNLAGEGQVDLDFWWKEIGDETHSQDGVYFSDNGGASFVKVLDLNGGSTTNNTWNGFNLDLDAEAAGAGLSLTSNFVVKFQQYDNYGVNSDGFAFDDISVTAGAAGSPPVAAFSGTPTSGTLPLLVNFTDASTNAPTGWSWTFGDGGSSTSQNPGHTYTTAGTYTVSLTASNAYGSDGETKTSYITVSEPSGGGEWETLSTSDFESGWQGWADGGSDCRRSSRDANYAHGGSYCVRLRDNTSTSIMTQGSFDASGYVELEIDFWFYPRSMENNEDFWLQFYNGSAWQTIGSWARGSDFDNDSFYNETVTITSSSYNFASNAQLRFRNDASGNSDWIYVDDVQVRGLTAGARGTGGIRGEMSLNQDPFVSTTALAQNSPNPFHLSTEISFSLEAAGPVRLQVYNVRGELVETLADGPMAAGQHQMEWNVRDGAGGIYFYRLEAEGFSETRKMIKFE